MEPKNEGLVQMTFLFKPVIFRFQPFNFQTGNFEGVCNILFLSPSLCSKTEVALSKSRAVNHQDMSTERLRRAPQRIAYGNGREMQGWTCQSSIKVVFYSNLCWNYWISGIFWHYCWMFFGCTIFQGHSKCSHNAATAPSKNRSLRRILSSVTCGSSHK